MARRLEPLDDEEDVFLHYRHPREGLSLFFLGGTGVLADGSSHGTYVRLSETDRGDVAAGAALGEPLGQRVSEHVQQGPALLGRHPPRSRLRDGGGRTGGEARGAPVERCMWEEACRRRGNHEKKRTRKTTGHSYEPRAPFQLKAQALTLEH